jgi:uncharacterized protein YcbX
MAHVAEIWRHPLKSHGREQLSQVKLTKGRCLPYDRNWAVAHDAAKLSEDDNWAPCVNFSRGSKSPHLMAIDAHLDETNNTLHLRHPEQGEISFNPDQADDKKRFLEWVLPISPKDRALPHRLITTGRGLTDTEFQSVSFINLASHREIEEKLGQTICPTRWRGNFLLEGLAPWQERDWIGKRLRIGEAEFKVREHIVRCLATTANPKTGERDADTLGTLKQHWNHQDCGVYAVVTKPGIVEKDAVIEVLS